EDAVHSFRLADVLRDYANSQVKQGRLREATENVNRSLRIAGKLLEGDAKRAAYRRSMALALLNLAAIEYRQGKHEHADQTEKTIQRSVALFRELVEGPPEERHPYEPLLLTAALNLKAMIERAGGKLEGAAATHKEAVKELRGMQEQKSKLVNEADGVHFMAECRLEQSKTWARTPKYLPAAEKNLGVAINNLTELARNHTRIPTYRESLGAAYQERGQLRLQGRNYQGARDDLRKATEVLATLVEQHGALPGPRGALGKAYAGLGQVALQLKDEDPAQWLTKAATELRAAVARSPEDAQLKRALDDLIKNAP
ncbi:MAG: hypothetical protein L0Z62_30520, partial [Gemmataceae bacterium]|nr:hypothetical protein [Gemmataceae bacterium]